MWETPGLSCSPSEIVGLLRLTNGQGRGAGRMVDSGPIDYVPFSTDAAMDRRYFGYRTRRIGTSRLVVLFGKVMSATHISTRGLKCDYVGIVIVLFVLSVAVSVAMCGGCVI